jgi:hypothetical protein
MRIEKADDVRTPNGQPFSAENEVARRYSFDVSTWRERRVDLELGWNAALGENRVDSLRAVNGAVVLGHHAESRRGQGTRGLLERVTQ